jgi:hypothetical protein
MPEEFSRTTKRKRINSPDDDPSQSPSDSSSYVDVRVITKVSFIGRNGQEWQYTVDNSGQSARKTHKIDLNATNGDTNQKPLKVERIDMWPTIGMSQDHAIRSLDLFKPISGQETQNTFDNNTGENSKPPSFTTHLKTHVYRFKNPDDDQLWIDSELIDSFSIIGPNGQEEIFTLKNPAAGDDAGQADPGDPDISDSSNGIDPYWRTDPFQNIVDFNLLGIEFAIFSAGPDVTTNSHTLSQTTGTGWPQTNGCATFPGSPNGNFHSVPSSVLSPPYPFGGPLIAFVAGCNSDGSDSYPLFVPGFPDSCSYVTHAKASTDNSDPKGASFIKTNGDSVRINPKTMQITMGIHVSGGFDVTPAPWSVAFGQGGPDVQTVSGFPPNSGAQVKNSAGKPVPISKGSNRFFCEGSSAQYQLQLGGCTGPHTVCNTFPQDFFGACVAPGGRCVPSANVEPNFYSYGDVAQFASNVVTVGSFTMSWSGDVKLTITSPDGSTSNTLTFNPVGWQIAEHIGSGPDRSGSVMIICKVQPKS